MVTTFHNIYVVAISVIHVRILYCIVWECIPTAAVYSMYIIYSMY